MSICQGLIEDQDISGIGVRVTFYVQSFLIVLASVLPDNDITGSYWALTLTTFSLLISALIEAIKNNLSLYNAMLVSYLCTLHVLASQFVFSTFAAYPVNSMRLKTVGISVAAALQSIGSTAFGCYIWQRAKTFGSQPECNADTMLIFFGKSKLATQSGRKLGIGFLAWILVTSLIMSWTSLFLSLTSLSLPFRPLWARLPREKRVALGKFGKSQNSTMPRAVEVLGTFCYLPAWLYIVVTMELTIQRNPVIHGPAEFGFGQVFPLISIAVPLYAVLSRIRGKRDRDPSKAEFGTQTEHERPAERAPDAVPGTSEK